VKFVLSESDHLDTLLGSSSLSRTEIESFKSFRLLRCCRQARMTRRATPASKHRARNPTTDPTADPIVVGEVPELDLTVGLGEEEDEEGGFEKDGFEGGFEEGGFDSLSEELPNTTKELNMRSPVP